MSRSINLHAPKDGEALELTVDLNMTLQLTELRIQPASNWKYPHRVLGKGGASVILTCNECADLISQYMRLCFFQNWAGIEGDEKPTFERRDRSFYFEVGMTDSAMKERLDRLEQLSHRP